MRPLCVAPARLACLAILLLAAATASAQEHVIPSERCGSFFLVPVTLSGEGRTLTLFLDTGAERTVLDPDAVERLTGKTVRPGRRVRIRDATAGPLRIGELTAKTMEMGHLCLALGREIDGILGFDAFQRLLLTLDYPAGEVRVGSGSLPEPDGVEVFELAATKRPFLALEIAGSRVPILLDSGSSSSFALSAAVSLDWRTRPSTVGAYTRIDRLELRKTGRAAGSARLGAAILQEPIVEVTDGTQLVGTPVMDRFAWTFDARRGRVRMRAADPGPIRMAAVRGTGALLGPREGRLEVLRVLDGSPAAAAGMQEGDVVTAIDGLDVTAQGCERRDRAADRAAVTYRLRGAEGGRDLEVPTVVLVP